MTVRDLLAEADEAHTAHIEAGVAAMVTAAETAVAEPLHARIEELLDTIADQDALIVQLRARIEELTPKPPEPTWAKPVVGIIGGDNAGFDAINALVGPVALRRTYDGNLPASFATSKAAPDLEAGRETHWSWKPNLKAFPGSGAQQEAFSAFLDTIPVGHKTTVVAWHEPEDNIEKGEFTLAEWGALQTAVGRIVRSKGRPELRFGICLMGPWTFDSRSGRVGWDWLSCLDWSLVDVFGIDPYRTKAGSTDSLEKMLTVCNSGSGTGKAPSMMEALASFGKPISLMEWGCYNSTEASVATFIEEAWSWMKTWNQTHLATPIESALWFNYTLIGSDNPLTGAEIPAYAAIVADSKVPVT